MGTETRTRTTIETEYISIIASRQRVVGWCERCGHEVQMLSLEAARQFLESRPDKYERRGQSKLHLQEAKDGLVICLKSLARLLQLPGSNPDSRLTDRRR
jgi:hypothetical protein